METNMVRKVFSLFHNHRIRYSEKNFIIEGKYDTLPMWHKLYDEEYIFDYNNCGIIEVYMNTEPEPETKDKNEDTIKIISFIDGGYLDDDVDYTVLNYAYLESENENGEKNKLPEILKSYFKNYRHGKNTDAGTILTENDIKHLNDKEINNDDYDYDDYDDDYNNDDNNYDGCDNDDNYDGCDDFCERYCNTFNNK